VGLFNEFTISHVSFPWLPFHRQLTKLRVALKNLRSHDLKR
jgi:hypothetical protein